MTRGADLIGDGELDRAAVRRFPIEPNLAPICYVDAAAQAASGRSLRSG
jgi:hypothetical protein